MSRGDMSMGYHVITLSPVVVASWDQVKLQYYSWGYVMTVLKIPHYCTLFDFSRLYRYTFIGWKSYRNRHVDMLTFKREFLVFLMVASLSHNDVVQFD